MIGSVLETVKEIGPTIAVRSEGIDPWPLEFLFSRAHTIEGGTSEIQRTIIGERLPRPLAQAQPVTGRFL